MSNSCAKLKCKKCHCSISEESNGRLCDNCNMDLIAQNLAAELSQHEIHRRDAVDFDTSVETTAETSCADISRTSATEEVCSEEATKTELKSDETESILLPQNPPDTCSTPIDPQLEESEEPETFETDYNEIVNAVVSNETKNDLDEPELERTPEIEDCSPSTSFAAQSKNEKPLVDKKRKFDDTAETPDRNSKSKDEDSSEEEPDVKKPDIKLEPMRTRAKVVQEEAAAMKQLDLSMEEERIADGNDDGEEDDDTKGPVRRLTRKALSEIEKYKHPSYEPIQTKSRRTKTFKSKPVYKAPTSQARIYSSDYVFHKGRYYQTGDVVSIRDTKRPGDYFAQITSFLTDQYCHKCATIQWLFPTKQSPLTGFDPRTYFLGYLDEVPRPLSALQPVMHLPSDYYRFNKTPYPPPTPDPLKKHYLWKRTEPVSLDTLLG